MHGLRQRNSAAADGRNLAESFNYRPRRKAQLLSVIPLPKVFDREKIRFDNESQRMASDRMSARQGQ